MLSSSTTQHLCTIFLKSINAKKCLDIGVFTGYSSLNTALTIPDDGVVYALEYNKEIIENVAKKFWKKAGARIDQKIIVKIGKANDHLDEFIKNGESSSFDFAFIDADKENYLNYYEKCIKLLKSGGILIIDNTLWKGSVYRNDIIFKILKMVKIGGLQRIFGNVPLLQKLNDVIHKDCRIDVVLLPFDDGVTVVRKI